MAKTNLDIVGQIISKRSDGVTDEDIKREMANLGFEITDIEKAINAIEADSILKIKSIWWMTLLSPSTYTLGSRKITKDTSLLGIFNDIVSNSLKTIDKVNIVKALITSHAILTHTSESGIQENISIEHIKISDAEKIQKLYGYVIDAQRKKAITVSGD